MLNLRRTIIFCVLFVAVWVQSTNAKEPIEYLEEALERVYLNRTLLPRRSVDHLKSWESWKDVRADDRARITLKYKELVEKDQLRLESGRNDKSMNKLSEWACKALDEDVKLWIRIFKTSVEDFQWMASEMKKVGEEGKLLESLAHAAGPYGYILSRRSTDIASSST